MRANKICMQRLSKFYFSLKIRPECCGCSLVTNMSSVLHSHLPLEAADLHNWLCTTSLLMMMMMVMITWIDDHEDDAGLRCWFASLIVQNPPPCELLQTFQLQSDWEWFITQCWLWSWQWWGSWLWKLLSLLNNFQSNVFSFAQQEAHFHFLIW